MLCWSIVAWVPAHTIHHALAHRLAAAGGTPYEGELRGCFLERPGRALPNLLADSQNMTTQLCRQLALAQRYRFWAASNTSQCYAGNVDPTYLARSSSGCVAKCAGDQRLGCGGAGEVFVHELPLLERELLACFLDPSVALRNRVILEDLTPEACRKSALGSGHNHYGMQGGTICFRQTSFDEAPELEPYAAGCLEPCGGDRTKPCGGPLGVASAIYRAIPDVQGELWVVACGPIVYIGGTLPVIIACLS